MTTTNTPINFAEIASRRMAIADLTIAVRRHQTAAEQAAMEADAVPLGTPLHRGLINVAAKERQQVNLCHAAIAEHRSRLNLIRFLIGGRRAD